MAFSTQQNFVGVLDGTNVNELNRKIDYKKTKLEDRKKVINDILDNTKFYEEYFSNYFNPNINSGDYLSNNINVCRSLERMANYLLNSDEIKEEEDKEKVQYVFHTDPKYFQKKMDREMSIESMTKMKDGNHSELVIHFLKRDEKNFKKSKTQKITVEDLNRKDELGRILRDYKKLEDFTTSELKKKESNYNRYLLTKVKGQLSEDMIYTKDSFLGVFGYDLKAFSESTKYNFDVFDFTNKNHLLGTYVEVERKNKKTGKIEKKKEYVKGLLYFKPDFDPNNELSFVLKDLQETIDKANLTETEKFVLEQVRNGVPKIDIAKSLDTHHVKIVRTMEIIANKVAKVGNKYDAEEQAY
ncbi:hypothetical protein [Geobacillus phage GR1]|nr:hypothetical protein [Geobacillus phage GR1]